jgi:hypothetical protein
MLEDKSKTKKDKSFVFAIDTYIKM